MLGNNLLLSSILVFNFVSDFADNYKIALGHFPRFIKHVGLHFREGESLNAIKLLHYIRM